MATFAAAIIYVYTNMNTQTCTHKRTCLHADSEKRGTRANASPLISYQADRKAADNKSRKSRRILRAWLRGDAQ